MSALFYTPLEADFLTRLNGSKLLWGAAAMVFNMGSRFVISDLTPAQQRIFQHPLFKRLAVFCMLFASTRDVLLSFAMAFVVNVLLEVFLNERHKYALVSGVSTPPVALNLGAPGLPGAVLRTLERKLVEKVGQESPSGESPSEKTTKTQERFFVPLDQI